MVLLHLMRGMRGVANKLKHQVICHTFLIVVLALAICSLSSADPLSIESEGHIKLQTNLMNYNVDDIRVQENSNQLWQQDFDFRWNVESSWKNFKLIAHAEFLSIAGSNLTAQKKLLGSSGRFSQPLLATDENSLFDLSKNLLVEDKTLSVVRLDRLTLGYLGKQLTATIGRHALSWGSGIVFQVLDLFNPFSPSAIDKDYKPGDDMLYLQWLYKSGNDSQLLIVPHRNFDSQNISERSTSYAFKHRGYSDSGELDYDILLMRHFNKQMIGLALNHTLLEGIIRFDSRITISKNNETTASLLLNYDRFWDVSGTNVYGFVEYFYNGIGVSKRHYSKPNKSLISSLRRGELFTIGRHYLALGAQVELHPLVNVYPLQIINLADSSTSSQLRTIFDMHENLSLISGFSIPMGKKGTEFGGFDLLQDIFLKSQSQVYLRLVYFF